MVVCRNMPFLFQIHIRYNIHSLHPWQIALRECFIFFLFRCAIYMYIPKILCVPLRRFHYSMPMLQ